MRRLAAPALTLALVSTLCGCGDQEETYCDALRQDRTRIDEIISSSGGDALLAGLPVFRDLADEAPDDLTDEWQTFVNALEGLQDALRDAGVKPSQFRGGRIPTSVTGDDRRSIIAAADTLSSAPVVSAVSGIETQGRDVCKVNLGL
ncbi:MAG TPA: hypothetical protein VIL10_03335 [Marmoricola sp.]